MLSKHAVGLALLSGALLCAAVLLIGRQRQSAVGKAGTLQAADSYGARVEAVRRALAEERAGLGLKNLPGKGSTPEATLGEPSCQNRSGGGGAGGPGGSKCAAKVSCDSCSKGAPFWTVNMAYLNFYMVDTPLWYRCPIGPAVELKLSYNSLTSVGGAFGNKWQLNYGTYAYRAVDDDGAFAGIMIIMPDGKQDLYPPLGAGVYGLPYHTFHQLAEPTPDRFELAFPEGTVYVYDVPTGLSSTVSLLTEVRDAYGQKLTLGYGDEGHLTTITDALGKVTTLTSNGEGLVTRVTDPFGRMASFEYDANRNLTKATDMGGYWTSFTYDHYALTDYYLASMANAAGTWGFTFEPADGLGDGTDPYPAPGTSMGLVSRLTVTSPLGGREEFYRDATTAWHVSARDYVPYSGPASNNHASNPPKTLYTTTMTTARWAEVGSIVTPEGGTTTFEYDDAGCPGSITGMANGLYAFRYAYNAMGNITSITDPSGRATQLGYAANGVDLTAVTDGLGTVSITYNGAHGITSLTDRAGNRRSTVYDAYGRIVSATDALGTVTTYVYGSDHFLAEVVRGGRTLQTYTHDAMGRIRTYTDATGLTRTYEYNALDDVTRVTYPDGRSLSRTYSPAFPHLVTASTDPDGLTTEYVHSASRALTHIVDPQGLITGFAYDANGNQVQLADPKGQVTRFAYDKDNRLVRKIYADGTASSYTYTALDRIASATGARSLSSYWNYTASNEVAGVSHTADLAHRTYPTVFQYDAHHRVASMVDGLGTTAYSYDPNSLITGIDGPLGEDTLTFQYDGLRRLVGCTLEKGQSVTYAYDDLGRLTQVLGGAGAFAYAYTGAGPLVRRLTRPNGSYTEYQYDALNRLVGVANRRVSGDAISQYAYAYDAHDRRASETVTNSASVTSLPSSTTTYAYSSTNALLNSTDPAQTFTHDADGNLTQWHNPEGRPFTGVYDIRNRLISAQHEYESVTPPLEYESWNVTYRYGGRGTVGRKEETYSRYSTGAYARKTVRYVGYGLQPLQERDEDNNALREYTWGQGIAGGIGGLLSLKQGGQDYYYLYDGRGNVTAVIDGSQAVVATYTYDPFGNLVARTGGLDQPYQFSSKPYDATTGLTDFGYRLYLPTVGRWTTRDPLGEAVGPNLYAFVNDDPLNRLDPTGLEECSNKVTVITCSETPPVESPEAPSGAVFGEGDWCVTSFYCAPEKSVWERFWDWLDSFPKPGPIEHDRVLGYQCRILAAEGSTFQPWSQNHPEGAP